MTGMDSYSGHPFQLITGDKAFQDPQNFLEQTGLAKCGFDYHVVAVFGSQSTGKSTLLNRVFGTCFATMDNASRQQTTKGIWISRARNSRLLVMDVEGTDGRERADDQDFERKSALFSLATSEVLLINLWENQTVFEVNLQMFHHKERNHVRSRLVFVIRDYLGTTPLHNLAKSITHDLEKIWSNLVMPTGLETVELSLIFDVDFIGLPHKILMTEGFDREVDKLRDRFLGENNGPQQGKSSFFLEEYHRKIPADGFFPYCHSIWETIESNKDLDLPSQQQLLAQFRCDEIAAQAICAFEGGLTAIENGLHADYPNSRFGADVSQLLEETLCAFDLDASRYNQGIYMKKRKELLSIIDSRLTPLFRHQISCLRARSVKDFEIAICQRNKNKEASSNFKKAVMDARSKEVSLFSVNATACCVEPLAWTFSKDLEELNSDLDHVTKKLQTAELDSLRSEILGAAQDAFRTSVSTHFMSLSDTTYGKIIDDCITDELPVLLDKFEVGMTALDLDSEHHNNEVNALVERSIEFLISSLKIELDDKFLLPRLRDHFEHAFKFDSKGIPKIWQDGDDIDGHYTKAKDNSLGLIHSLAALHVKTAMRALSVESCEVSNEFASINLIFKSLPTSNFELISAARQAELATRLKTITASAYIDAKRSTVSSVANIPLYFYGLLLILGWNELVALIRNPLYFITIGLAAVLAVIMYKLNLAGPVEQVAKAMLETVFAIMKQKLRTALEMSPEISPSFSKEESDIPGIRAANFGRSRTMGSKETLH